MEIIMHEREARKFDQLYTKFVRELELKGYAEVSWIHMSEGFAVFQNILIAVGGE